MRDYRWQHLGATRIGCDGEYDFFDAHASAEWRLDEYYTERRAYYCHDCYKDMDLS